MKLPFTKKSTVYYDRINAEYFRLDQEVRAAQGELQEAEVDCEQKRQWLYEANQRGSRYQSSEHEKNASLAASEASHRVSRIKASIGELEGQINPLRRIALAPDLYDQAKKELAALATQGKGCAAQIDQTDGLIAKLIKRVSDLQTRIASETASASQTLFNDEVAFVVPEALHKMEAELRLVGVSLTDLQAKREGLGATLSEIPKATRDAHQEFIGYRAVVAEIELYEQLQPAMILFARASAARRQAGYGHDLRRFDIEIPHELLEPAAVALDSELARA